MQHVRSLEAVPLRLSYYLGTGANALSLSFSVIMRQTGSVQVQDLSASPTFTHSRAAANTAPDVPATLRRNLFGSHLSRRPVVSFPNASSDRMPDPFLNVEAQQQPDIIPVASAHRQRTPNGTNNDLYGLRRSASRSLSPTKSQAYTSSSSSVIALDPVTGRPLLPIMPQLPSRMPEGSDDEEEDGDNVEGDMDDEAEDDDHGPWRRIKAFENHPSSQYELDMHSSSIVGMTAQQSRLHDIIDTSGVRIDLPKVQSILLEMQTQQKARARTTNLPDYTPSSTIHLAMDGVSARTRGKARTVNKMQPTDSRLSDQDSRPRVGGIAATLDPADKDELLSAIMTGLSRRVQQADEEAWMFGDERSSANASSGLGGFGFNRDEMSIGF